MTGTFAIETRAQTTSFVAADESFAIYDREVAPLPRPIDFAAHHLTTTLGILAAAVTGAISPTAGLSVTSVAAEAFSPKLWSVQLSDAMQVAVEEMEGYRGMDGGWDGVGSIAPDDATISNAEYFLGLLPYGTTAPEAMASADGDVGWYWKARGSRISVLFESGGKMAYFAQQNGKPVARGIYSLTGTTALPADLLDALRTV